MHSIDIIVSPEEFDTNVANYCNAKGITYEAKDIQDGKHYKFHDRKNIVKLNLYFRQGKTSKVVVLTQENDLQKEIGTLINHIRESRQAIGTIGVENCCAKYNVDPNSITNSLKDVLSEQGEIVEDCCSPYEVNNLLVTSDIHKVRTRLYANGTLIVQGRRGPLWDNICSILETLIGPNTKEVAARFVSNSEAEVDRFLGLITPRLVSIGETSVQQSLGKAAFFLSEWDKKYITSTFCLLSCELVLPEYSCIVMPAAKAFEGYVKSLALHMRWIGKKELMSRNWNFNRIWERQDGKFKNSKVQEYVSRSKYRDKYIEQLRIDLDFCRNFMMHSDQAVVTKVTSCEDAKDKIKRIVSSIYTSYNFFVEGQQ